MVNRYETYYDAFDGCVVADVESEGTWVSYDDYKALKDAADELARRSELQENGVPMRVGYVMDAITEYRKATNV